MMKYKNYTGHVEFDDEAEIFHGEVLDTTDVVTFQGTTPEEIKQAFHDSVDDYLDFCEERNEKPERPFSGKLVLRMSPELHHNLFLNAKQSGKSINSYITDTLSNTQNYG